MLTGITYDIVLISTYWNVNQGSDEYVEGARDVLISTYWNVNFEFVNPAI